MRVAYVRSSTEAGSRDYQLDAIGQVDRVFEDVITGTASSRPALNEMLEFVRAGDVVVVHSVSRLGRSLRVCLEIVEKLQAKGCQLISVKEGFDAGTPVGKLVMSILASVAELEREQIVEKLQSARRISTKPQGRKPTVHNKLPAIQAMIAQGKMTHTEIIKAVGVSKGSFYKLLREIE